MRSAIVAKADGSSSARRRSKKAAISCSKALTAALTRSTRRSTTPACDSSSPSRSFLRAVILVSVSSRIRAISPLDQSRIEATSSSALRRSSVISSAASAWTRSLAAFASAANRSMVSTRAASAVACMALVRSARNLLGFLPVALRAGRPSRQPRHRPPGQTPPPASTRRPHPRMRTCPGSGRVRGRRTRSFRPGQRWRARRRSWQQRRSPRRQGRRSGWWHRPAIVRIGFTTVGGPGKPESRFGVGRGHGSEVLARSSCRLAAGLGGRPSGPGIRDVEASCQRW